MYATIEFQVKQIGSDFDWQIFKQYKNLEDIDIVLFRKYFGHYFEFRVVITTLKNGVIVEID